MSNEVYWISALMFARFFPQAYQITDIVCYFELPVGACTLCMDDTLWYTFAVKVGQQINQMEVLQQ